MMIEKKKIILLMLALLCAGGLMAEKITVSDSAGYRSIEESLTMARAGDTIMVNGGHYFINRLQIKNPVVLIGNNNPVIDGAQKSGIFDIYADGVTVSGFIFKNAGVSFMEDNAAIKLHAVKEVTIENNVFLDNFFAIYLAESENCIVRNNRIESHGERETSSGNGIHLWYCRKITVTGNEVRGHRDGIYFEFVQDGFIEKNLSEANLRYGLHFMFSDNCRYVHNTFRRNGAGVAVMYTRRVHMEGNRFEYNWGPASFGLLLKEINDSVIINNQFYNNSTALFTEASNRLEIKNNVFENNGWAVKIMANSMDNNFTANDFINNSFAVATNSRQNFNRFDGNYWQDYKGYDLNRDGTGDVPHRPVGLFSLIVEKQSPALVLLKSFFISLLEVSESIFPVLTPEALADKSPRMRRIH